MKQAGKKTYYAVILLIAIFFIFIFQTGGGAVYRTAVSARADTSNFSSVLADLQKDGNFKLSDYPENPKDYSIQVIQIAESESGNLFLYTYQPCQNTRNLTATKINMSLSETADDTGTYGLEQVSTWSVFCKYEVNGVKVSSAAMRYYNITSIYRDFIKDIDKETGNGNITNGKAYDVGQCWKVTTQGETLTYEMLKVETVEIINPFTSYVRRNKNHSHNYYFQDNYYVAFRTNRNIEELLSATVEYRIQDYFYKENNVLGFGDTAFWDKATFSNERRTKKDVYCDEVNELNQDGFNLFGIFDLNKKFSWKRIQSSDEFVNNAGASDSDNEQIKKLQWVLMFDETSVYRYEGGGLIVRYEETGQIIDEVTILRLEFVENGITYNLGAVSDTVSKDHDFSDKNDGSSNNSKKQGFFAYIWNCLVKLFTGKAGVVETIVAVSTLFGVVIAVVLAVKFSKWVYSSLFK